MVEITKTHLNILAFDTSTNRCTVWLQHKSKGYGRHEQQEKPNSDKIFVMIDLFHKKLKFDLNQLDIVAVGLGPGSFTGLRIGVSAAKAFAYAAGARMIGISSLELIAERLGRKDGNVAVSLEAGRGNVYSAFYSPSGVIRAPRLESVERFLKQVKPGYRYGGSAAVRLEEQINERLPQAKIIADIKSYFPSAKDMISIALKRWHSQQFDDVYKLKPDYLYAQDCNITKRKSKKI